jgi:NAD(P)-dependent dehydrogenase (short-subunit alcohol dehydrogenase family)
VIGGDVERPDGHPLDGRVAIVTGSSRSIGRHIATVLASAGASVVVTGREHAGPGPGLAETVAAIEARGGTAKAIPGDLTDDRQVGAVVDAAVAAFGRIDLLVNNAAMRLSTTILDTTPDDLERIFRTNVVAPFLLWRHVVPAMVAAGSGTVVDIISTNAPVQPFIGMAPYRMTKAALTFMSVDLAMELTGTGVAVNALDPGPIQTDGTRAIRSEREDRYGIKIPYHAQDPVDVLDAPLLWLVQQPARTFSGHVVRRVDFGRTWGPDIAALDDRPAPAG